MITKFIVGMLALSFVSATAFAKAKNIVNCDWNGNDDSVVIHQDANGQLIGQLSMVDHGTTSYKVSLVPVPPRVLGAGLTYAGEGFSLHINTDAPPSKDGKFVATLNVDNMGISDESFACSLAQ